MKLAILDRDGTLNRWGEQGFIGRPEAWIAIPGALEAVALLNRAGWHVVVATNQSGLGRGLFDVAALNAMHTKLHKQLAAVGGRIDAIFYCPHSPEELCTCRKPLPGLFEQIGDRYGVDLKQVPTVGDNLRDLQAGVAAGCEPHLVLTGKGAQHRGQALPPDYPAGTWIHEDLAAFVRFILEREARAPEAVAL